VAAALLAAWSRSANGTYGTRGAPTGKIWMWIQAVGLRVLPGAGDGNRTRIISLGSGAVPAARGADLAVMPALSDRGWPLVPWLMAR